MAEQKNEKLKGWKYGLMKHLSDATSVSTFALPIKATTDQLSGITDLNSIESRVKMTALAYLGLAQINRLRDYSKKKFKLDRNPRKYLHYLHDITFTTAFSIPIQMGVYLWSEVYDWRKIATTIGASLVLTGILGGPFGQFIDTYRELVRVKKSKNTPAFIKRLKNTTKRKVAVGLTAGSIAVTGALYSIIPNVELFSKPSKNSIEQKVEQVYENIPTSVYSVPVEAEK